MGLVMKVRDVQHAVLPQATAEERSRQEAVVMLRKCAFVLLSIFLRSYGASPQVVAASMVLIVAMSPFSIS